jgi:hypothetical protein
MMPAQNREVYARIVGNHVSCQTICSAKHVHQQANAKDGDVKKPCSLQKTSSAYHVVAGWNNALGVAARITKQLIVFYLDDAAVE